jgi:hypothetical protein
MRVWPRPRPSGHRPLPLTLRRIGDLTVTGTAREFQERRGILLLGRQRAPELVSDHAPTAVDDGVNPGSRGRAATEAHRCWWKGATVPDNVELYLRFHPSFGEDISLTSSDFSGENEALEAIAQALNEQRSLILSKAKYGREAGENGVVINLANVVFVRVSTTESDTTGQYL